MVNKMKTRLDSKEWSRIDEERVGFYFRDLGFKTVGEIAGLRMFELFNMNGIDNIRAWEMVRNLYMFLNRNHDTDAALEYGIMDQYFPFKEWRKTYKPRNAKVIDLVMAFDMNEKALHRLFGEISRAFYKSDEYSVRYYKYGSIDDVKDENPDYKEVAANE